MAWVEIANLIASLWTLILAAAFFIDKARGWLWPTAILCLKRGAAALKGLMRSSRKRFPYRIISAREYDDLIDHKMAFQAYLDQQRSAIDRSERKLGGG